MLLTCGLLKRVMTVEVPFFKPSIGDDEIAEVVDCLKSGWPTTGKRVAQFEQDFAEFIGSGVEAVAVNSATAGLHLALEAIQLQPGDEVIVPDYTFTATAEVVRYLDAEPVFADVDPATLNVNVESLEAILTPKTKAIMPVHFAGLPCDMNAISAFAAKHDLAVVEDAAHALPARSSNRTIGTTGSEATVFSFYANKTITTGEGGMLVTANEAIADRIRKMRLHGFDRNAFDHFKTGNWGYDVIAPGFKYNLTDIAAAIGIHQLKKANDFREALAARYSKALQGLPLRLPVDAGQQDMHSWRLYIVRLLPEAPVDRNTFIQILAEAEITCSVHYTPLHRLKYWKERYDLKNEQFPIAEEVFTGAVSLPLFAGITDEQFDHVVITIRKVLDV